MRGGSRKAKNRLSFHPSWRLNPEQFERGGRHVFNARILRLHLAIRKKHAGNQQRIDAMIATPCFCVVLEDARADFADGGLPGCAIAGGVTHDQIRSSVEVRTFVEYARGVDIADTNLPFFLVA